MLSKSMTPRALKYKVERAGHAPYFFSRKTMRFFGDTMKNYGVRDGGTIGKNEVWELYRKRPVKHGLRRSAYFDKTTFHQVFKDERNS